MAKKKRKKRRPADTIPEAPDAKRDAHDEEADDGGDVEEPSSKPDTSQSLPPTKKSTLPPELAHDDREIDSSSIVRFSGIVAVMTAAAMLGAWFLTKHMSSSEREDHAAATPTVMAVPTAPSDPKLQRLPVEGLAALREKERERLEEYGWIDKKTGVVHMPIERAMKILAERGLPARKQGPPAARPVSIPNESSLNTHRRTGGKRGDGK